MNYRRFLTNIAIILYLASCIYSIDSQPEFSLRPNIPIIVKFSGEIQARLVLENITSDTSYVLCQVHTQYKNVTLSYSGEITPDSSVTGSNIGVITILSANQTSAVWYLKSTLNESISILINAVTASGQAPLPGGCNLEMNLEVDANLLLGYDNNHVSLIYQFANVALGNRQFRDIIPNCEDTKYQGFLHYNLYAYYLTGNDYSESGYFSAIQKMMAPDRIMKNGVKLKSTSYSDTLKTKNLISSYVGQGVVFNIIVEENRDGLVAIAAHVPIATYSCDLNNKDSSCYSIGVMGKILAMAGALVGLFLCFFGHRFFRTGIFLFAFLAFNIVFYVILGRFTATSILVQLILSAVLSVMCAALWLMLWWYFRIHTLSVLLSGLVAGYLIASIIFYTPFGNMDYWSKELNYGLAFTCAVLVLPVLILAFTKVLNILSCAFIGSYLFVVVLDVFLYGGLKNIILNSLRHAVIKEYFGVIVTGKFVTLDIILTCVWGILFLSGSIVQFLMARGRPDFPENSSNVPGNKQISRHQRLPDYDDDEDDGDNENGRTITERSSLINETRSRRTRYTREDPGLLRGRQYHKEDSGLLSDPDEENEINAHLQNNVA